MKGFLEWRLKKEYGKPAKESIAVFIVYFLPLWTGLIVWGIGMLCHTWPYPWAGITYATAYVTYFCGWIFLALESSMDDGKMGAFLGIQAFVVCAYLFGLAVMWWP